MTVPGGLLWTICIALHEVVLGTYIGSNCNIKVAKSHFCKKKKRFWTEALITWVSSQNHTQSGNWATWFHIFYGIWQLYLSWIRRKTFCNKSDHLCYLTSSRRTVPETNNISAKWTVSIPLKILSWARNLFFQNSPPFRGGQTGSPSFGGAPHCPQHTCPQRDWTWSWTEKIISWDTRDENGSGKGDH